MIDLSVIIPSYNTEPITLKCITSVLKNRVVNYEVIVIDNNSSDSTVASLTKEFGERINLIVNKENLGFSKAVNIGIKASKGKYILLLNSDTVVENDALSKLLTFARNQSDAGVVVPQLINADGSIQPSCFTLPGLKKTILEYWMGMEGVNQKYAPLEDEQKKAKVEGAVGAAFLITPRALEKVGLFDERYFMYFEDLDYCKRINQAGLAIYYYAGVKVMHLHGASGNNLAEDRNQWKRMIPSSKIYHGWLRYHLIFFVMWSGQKIKRLLNANS